MAITTGNSIVGIQTLQTAAIAPSKLLSVAFPASPLPPVDRLGYFWLFQYRDVAPFQCYVVESGSLRSPGVLLPIRLGALGTDWRFRLDASWAVPGVAWVVSIA